MKDKILSFGQAPPRANYQSGFLSLHFSGNLIVIKTRIGYAAGLAYDIDMRNMDEILGTIPGSDTILVVMREDVVRQRAAEIFAGILGVGINDIQS